MGERIVAERIITPYPFVVLQDLGSTIPPLVPDFSQEQADEFEQNLFAIERQFAPDDSTFYTVNSQQLTADTQRLVNDYVASRSGRQVGVLCLDRDIFENRKGNDFYRLQLSRSPNQELVRRRNCSLTPDEQFEQLQAWVQNNEFDELVVVDDVLAFGETAEKIVGTVQMTKPNIQLQYVVGIASEGGSWRGSERAQELTGRDPIAVYTVAASEEIEGGSKGMAIPTSRDLTLLGGKSGKDDTGEQRCYPYFLPFSKPLASIVRAEASAEASREFLLYNRTLFAELGRVAGRDIVLSDLALYAAGVPGTSLDEYRDKIAMTTQDKSMRIVDFIDSSLTMIAQE